MQKRKKIINQILHEFTQANFLIQKIMRDHNSKHKVITMMQYQVLDFCMKNKEISVSNIANFLKASISSTTQLIERLVKQNYLVRIIGIDDRRKVNIEITDSGNKYFLELEKHIEKKSKKVFENIGDQELELFLKVKKQIATNLCNNLNN